MTPTEFTAFATALDAVDVCALAAFRNASGYWAKGGLDNPWLDVESVAVRLVVGGPLYVLTKPEAQSLNRERLTKLKLSPSSPLP